MQAPKEKYQTVMKTSSSKNTKIKTVVTRETKNDDDDHKIVKNKDVPKFSFNDFKNESVSSELNEYELVLNYFEEKIKEKNIKCNVKEKSCDVKDLLEKMCGVTSPRKYLNDSAVSKRFADKIIDNKISFLNA